MKRWIWPQICARRFFYSCVASLTRWYGNVNLVFLWSLFMWFSIPIPELIQCYHSFSSLVTELDRRSLFPLHFWCIFLFGFGSFFCCFGCCLFVCYVFAMESWRLLDCVQVPYQFTFVASNQMAVRVCINWLIYRFYATCNWTSWTTWRKPRAVGRKAKSRWMWAWWHLAANVIFPLLQLAFYGTCSCFVHGHMNKYL